jgi:hypothetical protein
VTGAEAQSEPAMLPSEKKYFFFQNYFFSFSPLSFSKERKDMSHVTASIARPA